MCSEASRPPGPSRNTTLLIKITVTIKAVPRSPFLIEGALNRPCDLTAKCSQREAESKGVFPVCFQLLGPSVLMMDSPAAEAVMLMINTPINFSRRKRRTNTPCVQTSHQSSFIHFLLLCFCSADVASNVERLKGGFYYSLLIYITGQLQNQTSIKITI